MSQTQNYRAEQIENLATAFPRRAEASYALGSAASIYQSLPALRGYWPMGASVWDGADIFAADIATNYHLELVNNPLFSIYGASAPYIHFTRAAAQQLTYPVDSPQHQIIGNEPYVANPGLTIGVWVRPNLLNAGQIFAQKFSVAPGNYAYLLGLTITNKLRFAISQDGINIVSADATVIPTLGKWIFCAGRFTPGSAIDLFVDDVKYTTLTAIPTIFNSNQPFEAGGAAGGAVFLDGDLSNLFLSASALSDAQIKAIYWLTKPMHFGS